MEENDDNLFGHLVLYHIVNLQDQQQNIQLWHSDFSTNGSLAIVDVRMKQQTRLKFVSAQCCRNLKRISMISKESKSFKFGFKEQKKDLKTF